MKILITVVRPLVRYLFYQALSVNLDMEPVALPILREICESNGDGSWVWSPVLISGVWLTHMIFLEADWTVAEE